MKLPLLPVVLLATLSSFAQRTDTAWWVKDQRIQSISEKKDGIWAIRCWHYNGRPMCSGVFRLKSGLVPVTDITILDSNGKKLQEYIVKEGTLINYLPNGKVKDILRSPLHDTAERYTEYYTSGRIKQLRAGQKDTGKNGIFFFYPDYSRKVSFMYQQEGSANYHYQQFYPNGKIYWQQVFYRTKDYKIFTAWYKENGEVDTTCYIDKGKSGYSYDKVGRRLEWWNNGKLKSEEYFKTNYNDSVARYWHENGKLQMEKFFRNGSQAGVLRVWHENGRLKYYADYRTNSSGKPSLSFHENGSVATIDNDIVSLYDDKGNLTYESISIGRYSRTWDFRNGAVNNNTYSGRFDKIRKGRWMVYDDKGRRVYTAFYKNGLLDGTVLLFDTTGGLNTRAFYKEGKFHGEFLAMNTNGMDTLTYGNYDMGRKTDLWRIFFDNGRLQSVQLYQGKDYYELESYERSGNTLTSSRYDEKEQALYQYYYRNNKLTNMTVKHDDRGGTDNYYYFENGNVSQVSLYDKDGGYLRKTYYESGQQESEAYFKPGNYAHGRQYRWHPNGQKKVEGEMINGYQEGEWTVYNEDGTIQSTHLYVKGIEQVKQPESSSCFCDKPMPAIAGASFFNSAENFIDLKTINAVMRRFRLDSAYDYTFVRCHHCWPIPIIAVRKQQLWIGKDGMFLDLTPCMHGSNRVLVEFERVELKTIKEYFRDYDEDYDLVKPITLPEVIYRAMTFYERGDQFMNYKYAMSVITRDTAFFRKLLKKHYKVDMAIPDDDPEAEQEALNAAAEKFSEMQGDNDRFSYSFTKDLAGKMAVALLPYFPEQAKQLAKDSTDHSATAAIFRQLFAQHEPGYLEERLYGSMEAVLDSGTVALHLPASFISAWDTLMNKQLVKEGKPVEVPFMISFSKAMYGSYPSDRFVIGDHEAISYCAPAFAIASTGAWIRSDDFRYALGKAVNQDRYYDDPFSPYNYPAHYKNLHVRFSDMYRDVQADLDEYIRGFMGVVVKGGEMHVPGIKEAVPVKDVLIDAKEINGCVKVPAGSVGFSEVQLKLALEAAGFTVFFRNSELDKVAEPMVILYFHLKNQ